MTIGDAAHPEWVAGLAVVIAVVTAALLLARRHAHARTERLLGARETGPGRGARDLALLLATAAIAAALVGPRIGERTITLPASGVDVVFLVDVSRSMDATDAPPSRLDRAGRAVRGLLDRLAPQDRAALAVFAGQGVLLTPLTPDFGAVSELVSALDTDLMHPNGSRLDRGVRAALEAFESASQRPRALVVLSDGEGRAKDVGASLAARARARAVAVAIGSPAGAEIPDHGVPLRDPTGTVVVSRRDADRLGRLAAATGGALFSADEWGSIDLDAAAAAVRSEADAAPGRVVVRREPAFRVLPFAALAFALLWLEAVPRVGRRTAVRALFAATGTLAALGSARAGDGAAPDDDAVEARLRASPGDASALIDLGVIRLERGRNEAAARAFTAAALYAREPDLAGLAYFDLGVALLERGELEGARAAFFDAVERNPADRRARWNLEWTSAALRAEPPPPSSDPTPRADESPPPESDPPDPRTQTPESVAPSGDPWAAPPPDALERRRRLDGIVDDPARGLRRAARAVAGERPPGGEPAW